MYLVSAYFDDETNKILQGYINRIAADAKVNPHQDVKEITLKATT